MTETGAKLDNAPAAPYASFIRKVEAETTLAKAREAYQEARDVLGMARKAHTKARIDVREAGRACEVAGNAYVKAREAYDEARGVLGLARIALIEVAADYNSTLAADYASLPPF
jgi:hypothetical protein